MSGRVIQIDLDDIDACALENLWAELQFRHASRDADPLLFDGILQLLDEAERSGRLTEPELDTIRGSMSWCDPATVLGTFWPQLIVDRPALGAYVGKAGHSVG